MVRFMRNMRGGISINEGSTFKEDLRERAQEKLKELGDFPLYITQDLRDKIIDLNKEFLQLRQSKKFTEDKGIEINQEIDKLNRELMQLATNPNAESEDEEDRRRKPMRPKSKRKVCRCKK
jgi:polyhydroxyalkanoate synthesis regulator phasin